ncbi:hypothetical protein [Seonamhaeicola marinus]|uniref:DUF2975 domain-containing protein n=1 Tax=Seonamhaeicola marinus TaxID=1912246 RepID=A0A5D0HS16_9FLAO|nr:hypothetical protein [Seonamhaeicola marinus]TYA73931.1 hypothetical protein FUA24_11315 [Seonamhaeicola marinus]
MKKIRLLHRFLAIINIALIVLLFVILGLLVIPDLIFQKAYTDKALGTYNHLIIFLRGLLLLVGLFKTQQGLMAIIRNGFYNTISELKFKRGGLFLVLFGITGIIFNIITKQELELNIFITNFIESIFVILVGLGLFILADFIKSGGILKEENDLTI